MSPPSFDANATNFGALRMAAGRSPRVAAGGSNVPECGSEAGKPTESTAHPAAAWTAQQLREAWPWATAPRLVIRDRDGIYGSGHQRTAQQMGISAVRTAPRSPWPRSFVERAVGSLRRECLDHVIVWTNARHLQRHLVDDHKWRAHLSLNEDAPVSRVADGQPAARSSSPARRQPASS